MLKPIQHSLILALCALSPTIAYGATRDVDDAQNVAAEFFQSGEIDRLADKDALTLAHVVTDGGSFNPVCYVFNAKDGKGFVIVSADDSAMPVVGYSYEFIWDVDFIPTSAGQLLSAQVAPVYDGSRMARVSRAAQHQKKVLSTPTWSQEAPFNNNIPNRRLTGCVGVALAEILKYHQYPANRPASLVKDGESSSYAWGNMRGDNYRGGYTQEQADAVAALVADAAIAIGTDFGMSSSSAYEVKVPYALTSLFGYDAGVSYKKRSEIDKAAWDEVIVSEIDADRPVLYSGQDVSSGHAFVCDGYEIQSNNTPFFHINWGWGGSADGFYASDALNPVVSKAHSYNNLMTIVYNIKPATTTLEWSPIHVTSDESQVGLTLDVEDITKGAFSVRVGALKNISNSDFSGQLAVALFDAAGNQKALLNNGSNFSLIALQIKNYVDFNCTLPSGVSVGDGDIVRLVTKSNNSDAWLPVAGDLLAPGEALAKNGSIPYFNITLPASSVDADVTADEWRVIKGRDYSFRVVPKALDKVITVKANGFILSPDASNNYKLINVLKDQEITLVIQNAADVLEKSTLWLTAGNLKNILDENETSSIKDLTLFGTMNADDFAFIRERMKVERLDISQVNIVALGSNPANAIPAKAFQGYRSLKQIILPNNLTTFKSGCFNQTGLTSIEIPASVGTYEYNVFLSCSSLKEVTAHRVNPAWVNWCVFTGTPKAKKLIVPNENAKAAYSNKEYWQDFSEIVVGGGPVTPSTYKVSLQENKGLILETITKEVEVAPGSEFKFKVQTDDTYGDYRMEVYANADKLTPNADGEYSAKINRNTLIHVEFKAPEPTSVDNTWKISGAEGGIGMVTDVVNVPVGQPFNVRVNTIKVPDGYSSKFFALLLVDKNGGLKEIISPVLNNMIGEGGKSSNITYNFSCKVKESTVREGDQIRLATAVSANTNNRTWYLVSAEGEGIVDRLSAVGNMVPYHMVTLPVSADQYNVEGASGEVVRGMPYSFKVTPAESKYRVNVSVNGVEKATNAAVANITIPAVTEDIVVTVSYKELSAGEIAAANDYVKVDVSAGQLANKMNQVGWPEKLKLIGSLNAADFTTLLNNNTKIFDLDLSDVTVPDNKFPGYAFANIQSRTLPTLRTIILPNNVNTLASYAFYRCTSLKEVVMPPALSQLQAYAFSGTTSVNKITIDRTTPPSCLYAALPNNKVNVYVPESAVSAYKSASYWSSHNILAIEKPKASYHIDVDETRMPMYGSTPEDLSNISLGEGEKVTVWFALPNVNDTGVRNKLNSHCRYGVAFKLYDNGVDMFDAYQERKDDYPDYLYDWIYRTSGGGVYKVYIDRTLQSGPMAADNHKIELDFYYPILFSMGKGVEGVSGQIVNLQPNVEWKNVEMANFGGTGNRTLYKENSEIQFKINKPDTVNYSDLSVMVEQKIMTKTGLSPEYETQSVEIVPDDKGMCTITSIQGDTQITISLAEPEVSDGTTTTVEDILAEIEEGYAEEITEVSLSGELSEEIFEALNKNFSSLEVLDLSGIENESIPDSAFAGMENLQTITLPETVTEIGAGAFEGCKNIETLTLPGVVAIGEGAFEGCDNLTSILIPSAGTTPAHAPARVRAKVGEGTAITKESFRGLNPNCLIYMGNTDVLQAEGINVIINQKGGRVAAHDIVINGDYSFNAPTGFDLGDHSISLTINVPASERNGITSGWTGLMLPFTPTEMTYDKTFPEREGVGIHFVSFDDVNASELTEQTAIHANRPYMANVCAPFESVAVTFTAKGGTKNETPAEEVVDDDELIPVPVFDVPATPFPEEAVAKGKDFSLYGSFDGSTTLGTCYKLNEDKSVFVRPEANDSVKVGCFDAYLSANVSGVDSEFAVGEHPLWVYEPEVDGLNGIKLYRSSKIELVNKNVGVDIYYTTDGTDPSQADGTRTLYTEPFTMVGDKDKMTVRAMAEVRDCKSENVEFEIELTKATRNYNLAGTWNWISHNMEKAVAIADFAKDNNINRILSQTQETVWDPNFKAFVGALKELNPAEGYKVSTSADATANIVGVAYDPTTVVNLHKGWNWIGSPIDDGSLLVNDLLAGLKAEEGDMIVGLEGFTQADANGNWIGTLGKLIPGVGYMYSSGSAKEFAYNLVAANEEEKEASKVQSNSPWAVDIHAYPSVMPLTATLINKDGSEADANEYAVAAFSGNECRGVGVCVNGYMMINVHGVKGDDISFRFISPDNEEMISETSVVFSEMPVGSLASPYEISLDGTTVSVESVFGEGYDIKSENGSLVINGDLYNVESVEVYDLAGNKLAMSTNADNGVIKINELESGVRIIVIRANGSCTYTKVMVK